MPEGFGLASGGWLGQSEAVPQPPIVLFLLFLCLPAPAQDTVYMAASSGGRTRLTGRVVDYTGKELLLERPGGRQQTFPGAQVLHIETEKAQRHAAADEAFAKGQFGQAAALYSQAVDAEPRRWVRRGIIAQMVWCQRALGQSERAGETFLILVRDDPQTPYFDCIPLAWLPRQPSAAEERAARQWLDRPEPAAVLMGASYLLSGAARPAALARLSQLATSADRRVAQLAAAQTWRAEVITATEEKMEGWARAIEEIPEPLRAGPYYVLGLARASRKQWDQAALALLRVAILHPQQRALAAQSLLEAGRSLENLAQVRDALRLYRELIRTYPEQTRPVGEAQSRVEELSKQILAMALALSSTAAGAEYSADQRFLAGLRERGLFELGEKFCVDQLRRPDLPETRQADLVIELSRCLAERAVAAAPEAREPFWQRALKVTESFARQHPQNPRLLLVRLQGVLGVLARGELARQEAQMAANGGLLLDQARTQLRTAIRQLQQLADEAEQQSRERTTAAKPKSAELSAAELAVLRDSIRYELARALRNQGECYGSQSADRSNALNQAVQLLDPLAKLPPEDPLCWRSRVDLVACQRELADYDAARRMLDALKQQQPPPAAELRLRAEQIGLALAAGQLPEAVTLVSAGRELGGLTSPELDFAWLETYLAAWRAANDIKDQPQVARWQNKATEMVRAIEGLYGPYWGRRAEMLLAGSVRSSPETTDVDTLVRAAESSFRSGLVDDALAGYDRARTLAAKQGSADRAFELGYIAATIEHQRNRHDAATTRYRQIALAAPGHAKAADAHLLAIYHAGQIAKGQSAGSLEQYAALLQEHLKTWPQGPRADEVRRRLAQLREHQRDWQGAMAAYQAVSPGDPQYREVVESVARCCRACLAQQQAAGKATEAAATAAAGWFESLFIGPQGRLPERWSPVERTAALEAARLWLHYTPAGYERAQRILSAATQGAADAPPEWKSAAQMLLVYALAGSGRRREAAEALERLSAGPTDQLLGMLEGLARLAAFARPEVRGELARLQLRTIELLRPRRTQLQPAQQQNLDRIRAQVLVDAGRSSEALSTLKSLAGQYPRDGAIQEAYARALATGDDRASLQAALAKWGEVAEKSPPASERWFRAQYAAAALNHRLGNKQQALKIIRLLQTAYPSMGGPELKGQFAELAKRCEGE